MGYKFLSDEWFTEVKKLRDAAGDIEIPQTLADIVLNVNITGQDGDKQIHLQGGNFELGHVDGATTTMTLSADLARKIFVESDMAAGMQGFMAGEIKVEGDMTKLMAMQTVQPTEDQKKLTRQIREITE